MVSRPRHGGEVIGGSPAAETENVCTPTVLQSRLFPGSRAAGRCAGRGAPLDAVAPRSVMSTNRGPDRRGDARAKADVPDLATIAEF
jgi:hypothetical protein